MQAYCIFNVENMIQHIIMDSDTNMHKRFRPIMSSTLTSLSGALVFHLLHS